ncbi:MAG: flagellar hook-associated protein FlgK [Treponema sp.]|jgi:flagellar hook-associated protein 1 FlgK|nr:flagellar hook-associated protein FlgK [Treponema sp.]
MTSTFQGIEIGKRGVHVHQQGLNTTGHNLTNTNTEGYSRQRVEIVPFEPIYLPGLNREETPGQIGQGTVVERIERLRDQLLDKRIISQASSEGYWTARDPYLRAMDHIYLEPGDNSVRSKMDEFWDAWQELSLHPADGAPRTAVLERGRTLIDGIHERYNMLKDLQTMADEDIALTVAKVNDYSRQIAELNNVIQKVRAQGDNPNDLLDRRDLLVDKLSSIIDITIDTRDPDEFMVHTAGLVLVQGSIGRTFDMVGGIESGGFNEIIWGETRQAVHFKNGSLKALIDIRDRTIQDEIKVLDSMSMNFIDLVNEIHREAYGANGVTGNNFFSEYPFVTNVNGNYDRDGDGNYDSTYIYRINGVNTLEAQAQTGLEGVITLSAAGGNIDIPYYSTDTVTDIITRINNSGAEVVARLNRDGRLSLKATPSDNYQSGIPVNVSPEIVGRNPDFVIRHIEDSGHFLEGYAGILLASGPEGAYDWEEADAAAVLRGGAEDYALAPFAHPSGWIDINPALMRDPSAVAAGFGFNGRAANPGNGEAALAIAAIRDTQVMVGRIGTFDDYFAETAGRIGMLGEASGIQLETENQIMKDLYAMRQSVSGVNIDEELSNLIRYQQGYAAAARFITTVNAMLDTLINRMGV